MKRESGCSICAQSSRGFHFTFLYNPFPMLSTAEEEMGKKKRKWKEKEVHDLDLIDVLDQGCNCTL